MSRNLLIKKESKSSSSHPPAGFLVEDGCTSPHIQGWRCLLLPCPIPPHPAHIGGKGYASSDRDIGVAQCSTLKAVDGFIAPSSEKEGQIHAWASF